MTTESQRLVAFVRSLPVGPAYAPIYAKGQVFGKFKDVSTGKAPYEKAHHEKYSPSDVALLIEQRPDVFRAVGLFTGIRSDGLVILDVDSNLASLRKKWGSTLKGAPMVTSTKGNAAKFVFRVPEEQRSRVKGISGRVTGAGYEVLWGMQGLIAGEYPGSSDGTAPAGFYALEGDLSEVPEAPEWLLAEMRAAKEADAPAQGLIKNRKGLDFSGRTEDEMFELVQDCLSVLPHLGRGTEDYWWSVGAMVAEALPNEKGLMLWAAWSSEDPAFEQDWATGNPCEGKWAHIMQRVGRPGNKGLGSLIFLADQYDAQRQRFRESSLKTLQEVEKERALKFEQVYLSGKEVLERAQKIEEEIENPALQDQAKHVLALQAGRREGSLAIDRMLFMDMLYSDTQGLEPRSIIDMPEPDMKDYLIPGLLPKGWVLLLHADGGTGKTAACQTLVKHLTREIPIDVYGDSVPVKRSRVLWLNGDQNPDLVKKQFTRINVGPGADIVDEWDLAWYRRFCRIQNTHQYDLVVVDSLDGCNDSNPYEENRREYAKPIKMLAKRNGRDFPACTFIIIHHNTKAGVFRGTSAIKAAVDETWNMRQPSPEELTQRGLRLNSRVIRVEKSRDGREGMEMVFTLDNDFTYNISHLPPRIEFPTPQQYVVDVLRFLRKHADRAWSRLELDQTSELGGNTRSNRWALQSLLQQGLIKEVDRRSQGKGKPAAYYQAVLPSKGTYQENSGSLYTRGIDCHKSKTQSGTGIQNDSKCHGEGVLSFRSPGASELQPCEGRAEEGVTTADALERASGVWDG